MTDYASIPSVLWSFGLSPHGLYSRAAVIHDYLYWTQLCTRTGRPIARDRHEEESDVASLMVGNPPASTVAANLRGVRMPKKVCRLASHHAGDVSSSPEQSVGRLQEKS